MFAWKGFDSRDIKYNHNKLRLKINITKTISYYISKRVVCYENFLFNRLDKTFISKLKVVNYCRAYSYIFNASSVHLNALSVCSGVKFRRNMNSDKKCLLRVSKVKLGYVKN